MFLSEYFTFLKHFLKDAKSKVVSETVNNYSLIL